MRKLVLSLFVLALAAAPALAQPPAGRAQPPGGRFGGGFQMTGAMLLGQKSVQEDLKLSDDQIKKVTDLGEKTRAAFGGLQGLSREEIQKKMEENRKESEKAVAEILKPDQVKRLKQIAFQVAKRQGLSAALANPDTAKDLNLTDEQKEKLRLLGEDSRKFREELGIQRGQRPNEEQQKKLDDFRKSSEEKVTKMLTADQQSKLKEMAGAEFKGEIQPFGGRRPGGGGGGARPPRP
jgi:Spy/CpxP family protein refolding chaperone